MNALEDVVCYCPLAPSSPATEVVEVVEPEPVVNSVFIKGLKHLKNKSCANGEKSQIIVANLFVL